jgi:hypothetical protein
MIDNSEIVNIDTVFGTKRDRKLAGQARYRQNNKEKIVAYRKENKEEEKAYSREYRKNNKERYNTGRREYWGTGDRIMRKDLRKRYNLTLEEFEKLKDAQDNKCGICKNVFTKTPAIDHNHSTGNVRGLLCSNCNTGIGLLKDSVECLVNAINYLENDTVLVYN